MMENEKGCEGCIWEEHPGQNECNNCIRLVDAPFNNDDDSYFCEWNVVDNYENEY